MKKICSLLLQLFGWKIIGGPPQGLDKCVVAVGPHTSNWDFIIGRMTFAVMGLKGKFLIKNELFFFPLGWILKKLGGIPVDRKKANNLTDLVSKMFQEEERIYLVFTPEGTRSYNPNWKKGFYYIAVKAQVPIAIAFIDFSTKTGGFHSVFNPTGNVDLDIEHIKDILRTFKGKYPEKGII